MTGNSYSGSGGRHRRRNTSYPRPADPQYMNPGSPSQDRSVSPTRSGQYVTRNTAHPMDRVQARFEDLNIGTSSRAANQPSSTSRGRGFAHDDGEDDDMARYGAYDGGSREYRDYRDERWSNRHPQSRSPPRSRRESDIGDLYRHVPARDRQYRPSESGSGSDNDYAMGGSRFEASRRFASGDPYGSFPGSHAYDSWSGSARHRPSVLSPTSRPTPETYRYVPMMAHRHDGPPTIRPLSPPPCRRRRSRRREREADLPGTQYIEVIVDRDQDSDF